MPSIYRQVVLDRDRARPRQVPAPSAAAVEARLLELLGPAVFAVGDAARALGLRDRQLTLPVMASLVTALIWRQVPSVSELVRLVAHEDVLGVPAQRVTQQALSQRLRDLPADLFAAVLAALLPVLADRAAARDRPVPAPVTAVAAAYPQVWAVDGTTLETVTHQVGLRRPAKGTAQPAGKLAALLDAGTRLPVALWLDDASTANDLRFADRILGALPPHTLLLGDAQFVSSDLWDRLTEAEHALICRSRAKVAIQAVARVLVDAPLVRDRIVRVGSAKHPCRHPVRLIEVRAAGRGWHRLICTELDPEVLSTATVVDLYAQRWRIEEAFLLTKRLLGLSYLWAGAVNAIARQVWATWLLYAVLVDLTDAVAEVLGTPRGDLSLEMVYRGLDHDTVAARRGAAADPVAYLAAEAEGLGLVKRRRTSRERAYQQHHAWRAELNL